VSLPAKHRTVVCSLGPETVNYVVGWGDFNVLKHTLDGETGVSRLCFYLESTFIFHILSSFKTLVT